jgi:sugar (pentulose or hexulose) kinase
MGTALYWMACRQCLPGIPFTASFLPDYLVARLTGTRPVTDPTNAAGSGLYDIVGGGWEADLIRALGLPAAALPEVRRSGASAGGLTRENAAAAGLPAGLPVTVACGDNQASFAGSVGDYRGDLLVNVGTGGQVSAHVPEAPPVQALEARPYVDGAFLLVGAGLVGGRSYAWLREVFRGIGKAFYGARGDEDLYQAMNRLAEEVPAGADGLRCEPLFTGTRQEPDRRGLWAGIGTANFTPGHMARALLEGLAEQFVLMYGEMESLGAGGRTRLIGAGNGIRKNPLLRRILGERFGMAMTVPAHREEAAYGAALLASVGAGAHPDLPGAARVIRYGGSS